MHLSPYTFSISRIEMFRWFDRVVGRGVTITLYIVHRFAPLSDMASNTADRVFAIEDIAVRAIYFFWFGSTFIV